METFQKKIDELKPYKRNTKKHDQTQIDNVAESIRKFGFVQPIVVDKNGVIVIGHCRYFAAKQLGMEEVPCVSVEYLTPEQVNALRIIDNKTNESPWDMELLGSELEGLDLDGFQLDFDLDCNTDLTIDESELDDDSEKSEITMTLKFRNVTDYESCEPKITEICDSFSVKMSVKME